MLFQGIKGEICHQYGQLHIEWKLKDIFSLSKVIGSYYESPEFNFLGHPFYLQLYSNGHSEKNSEGWIDVYIVLKESCAAMKVKYTLGFKTTEGEIECKYTDTHTFASKNRGYGNFKALERSELRRVELTPSDVLTISVTLEMIQEILKGTEDACTQTDVEDNGNIKKAEYQPAGGENVLEAVKKLWDSGENSDVVIHVGDVEFKAHRAILGVRTPVLSAMFQHDTIEKTSGVVNISDCEPVIFEELLHYIYTGAPKELTTKNAPAIYALANKYLAGELKAQCLHCITSNLCVETFCDAVLLALNYGEAELLQLSIKFASKNILAILKSIEWQRFAQEHFTRANEILIKAHEAE